MRIYAKVVRVRKEHNCDMCGGVIPKGAKAILVLNWGFRGYLYKYPIRTYYHYIENLNPYAPLRVSPNRYRELVCSRW